jgi:hypothetical protein
MKATGLLILAALFIMGCEKEDAKEASSKANDVKTDLSQETAEDQPSGERRGGNGNGNGQGNQNTDPCANYPTYPLVYEAATDWNIKVDTTICGMVVFKWDPQPGFNPVTDTCYTIARYYYIGFSPISAIGGCTGGGSISNTNSYYYTLGAGCSLWPGGKYIMGITYYERNVELQKTFVRSSKAIEFTAGTRAPWLNNCN